jgi:hypothetical protein
MLSHSIVLRSRSTNGLGATAPYFRPGPILCYRQALKSPTSDAPCPRPISPITNYGQREQLDADARKLDDSGLNGRKRREPEICSVCGQAADIGLSDWKGVTFFCAAHAPEVVI